MSVLRKLTHFLSIDIVQRLFYCAALLTWILLTTLRIDNIYAQSSLGIAYIWITIIPSTILLAQIIFNHKIIWVLILGLIICYTIWTTYSVLKGIIEMTNSAKGLTWDMKSTIFFITFFSILFLIIWTTYKIKPIKKNKSTNA
jgi:hypothetical protein